METLRLPVVIARKHGSLAAFVVVPASQLAPWRLSGTTTVEAALDGVALGRRSLKRWDESRWFVELRNDHLAALHKAPGARATLVLARAATELPAELSALLEAEPRARAAWEGRTAAQRRMLREELLDARAPATRARRARAALFPEPRAPAPRVAGLSSAGRALEVRILATRLPGTECGPYSEVAVGFVARKGSAPEALVGGDARSARWETVVEVREKGGAPGFYGPAVSGPPHERFLYLTWIGRRGRAAPAMFRRAKLRLDAIPAPVLARALRTGALEGRLGLTAPDGMPLCASVRPPAIAWTAARP